MVESVNAIDDENGKFLWSSILSEVRDNSSLKLPSRKGLIILGDNESGKTTLLARLQGSEDPKKSSGLEYQYIDVKDEDRDDQTKLSVWLLDGDPYHSNLLKFSLTEGNFEDCMVMMVVSMSEPWRIMDSLQQWFSVLEKHVQRLKIHEEDFKEYKESLIRHFQDYQEPDSLPAQSAATLGPTSSGRRPTNPLHPHIQPSDGQGDKVTLPLGEGAFKNNLGIPTIVVVTKSDSMSMLEKEHDFRDEHFDFIQLHVRRFCLSHGAALFYTSVKEDKNCDLLSRYIQHRIYGFPFLQSAYVVEKDCIFVPTGWDNEKKIAILQENLTSMAPEDRYEDVVVRPTVRKTVQRDPEVMAEDEQVFMMRLAAFLNKQPGTPGPAGGPSPGGGHVRQDSPHRAAPGGPGAGASPRTPATAAAAMRTKGATGATPTAGQEGVLANFFNSLLTKRNTSPGSPNVGQGGTPTPTTQQQRQSPPADKAALTRDAQAELDRMNDGSPNSTPSLNADNGAPEN